MVTTPKKDEKPPVPGAGGADQQGGMPSVQMVQIPATEWEKMKTMMEDLRGARDMLLQVADKKQLSQYYERHRGKLPGRVNLRAMDFFDEKGIKTTKIIIGWRTIQDEVYQDPVTLRWGEKQRVELLYEDGTRGEFWLMDYVRRYRQIEAEVRSRKVGEVTGDVALEVVRLDNQKSYTIGITFVN
jgi:hypothetical protein